MATLNPWDSDAFSMRALSAAVELIPNTYGRLNELNLFPEEGVPTREIMIEEQNGVLNLLNPLPVGAPGQKNKQGKRKVRTFSIPHIPVEDTILPGEYQGIRQFGTENTFDTLNRVMAKHLRTGRNKFDITLEWMRMGALKGDIVEPDASTTIYNLFTEFGVSENSVDFALGTDATEVLEKCYDVLGYIEDYLQGDTMSSVRCLCDSTFFRKLITHPKVADAFKYHSAAQQALGGDNRKGFTFGGITFEEYRATATDADGNSRDFLDTDYARAFPLGTQNTFKTFFAPADFLETTNTYGKRFYAKQESRKYNRGVDIWMESNPLPICTRPQVLVEVYTSN